MDISSLSHWSWHRESSVYARYGHGHTKPALANRDRNGHGCRTFPEGPAAPPLDTQQTAPPCPHEDQQQFNRLLPHGWCIYNWRCARGTGSKRPSKIVTTRSHKYNLKSLACIVTSSQTFIHMALWDNILQKLPNINELTWTSVFPASPKICWCHLYLLTFFSSGACIFVVKGIVDRKMKIVSFIHHHVILN